MVRQDHKCRFNVEGRCSVKPRWPSATATAYPQPTPQSRHSRRPTSPATGTASPAPDFPHLPLDDGISTPNLVRDGRYLLLTGQRGAPGHQSHGKSIRAPPFSRYPLPRYATARPSTRPAAACGLSDNGALLVRPGHVIAWRAGHLTHGATAALISAARRALVRAHVITC
ncbi:hypothetical protein [Nocardia sp. CA-119907]|uniref:aromatic-ring hydroxylase C-terminal domain-containing protein n=1 Tax=Nocardia sp. CA-119907 TaxID=3239973 RepID=UPI003D97BE84